MPQLHCKIRGRVQGVCFRAATLEVAENLGLVGWVKNCPDGSVECLAEGPQAPLDRLRQWLDQGPPAAQVTGVDTEWGKESGQYTSFRIV